MQATLNEEIKAKFKDAIGINPSVTDVNQLQNRRYFLWAFPTSEWWIGIGFSFASDDVLEYPTIRLQIEVSARARPAPRQQIIEAMREIANRPEWKSYNLGASRMWSGILREQSLRTLLGSDDHITEIRNVCFRFLEELSEIKRQFPLLPWGSGATIAPPAEEG